ncbi:hypothetical protein D3C75_1316830 [compost metagenome]
MPLWLMSPRKSPQQMRAELPEFMRMTTGNEEALAPAVRENKTAGKSGTGDQPDED